METTRWKILNKYSEDVGVTFLTPSSHVSKAICMGFDGVKQARSCTRIICGERNQERPSGLEKLLTRSMLNVRKLRGRNHMANFEKKKKGEKKS